jgi:hypothetical protein
METRDVFIYIKGKSILPSGSFQQTTRTRNINKLYYYCAVKCKEAKYNTLDDVHTEYSNFVKTSNKIFNICGAINVQDDEVINKNSFFNLFCYNEYVADIYNTNKLKHYQNILIENGFILSEEGKNLKLSEKKEKEMKNILLSVSNELFADYMMDDDKAQLKYKQLNRNIEFLGLDDHHIAKYQTIITSEFELMDHLNIIRLLKSDKYIDEKIKKKADDIYDVKAFDNSYNKIRMLRSLEKKCKIGLLDVEFIADDRPVSISDDEYLLIKKMFRCTKSKPKTMKDFKTLYVGLVKHLAGGIIKTIQKGKKKVTIYEMNNKLIEYHLELSKWGNWHNNFHDEFTKRFSIVENENNDDFEMMYC